MPPVASSARVTRRVRLPSLAKLNLDLRILHKRPDGFHELRSIFQTVSLRDTITVQIEPANKTAVSVDSSIEIPDNIVLRAAHLILDQARMKAVIRFKLDKKIPMGAGLGGGSSNAASVLMGLPAILGTRIDPEKLFDYAATLGSDVPFFLRGGTALALGRGTELYPLPELPSHFGLIVSSGIHVSTAAAYQALGRVCVDPLTSTAQSHILREFQSVAWASGGIGLDQLPLKNDFEDAVFGMYPGLAAAAKKLVRLGAKPVRMTGSGSAIFGIFSSEAASQTAAIQFAAGSAFPIRFVSRAQYRALWLRALGPSAEFSCFSDA